MKEILQHPAMLTPQSPGRRGKLGRARTACLLVVLAAGIGLLAWTVMPDSLPAEEGKPATRDSLPREQLAPPAGSLAEILAHPDVIPTHHHPLLGRQAPDLELADCEGKVWNLTEFRAGRPVVLIFYYGYHCVGCVRQLFDVHRELPRFHELDACVVAVSADAPELTRRGFKQNGPFGFPVLADPGNKTAEVYQIFKRTQDGKLAESRRHGIFIIDRNGTVQWVNVGDAPLRRNGALLTQLAKMAGRMPPTGLGPCP